MEKRLDFIDVLKGLGILLVILGHSTISGQMFSYIYSFHMPLFFFISGYLFSYKKYSTTKVFLIKKIKTLLLPYLMLSAISILWLCLVDDLQLKSIAVLINEGIISKRNGISYNVPLWFLTTLFIIELVYYCMKKYKVNEAIISILVIISSYYAIVHFGALGSDNTLPWSIDAALMYILFFHIGYILKGISIGKFKIHIGGIICIITSYIIFKYRDIFNQIFIYNPESVYGNLQGYIREITLSIVGILTWLYIAIIIKKSKIIGFFGRNSLLILGLHAPIGLKIASYLIKKININLTNINVTGILETVLTLMVLTPIILIINRYFPIVVGKVKSLNMYESNERINFYEK